MEAGEMKVNPLIRWFVRTLNRVSIPLFNRVFVVRVDGKTEYIVELFVMRADEYMRPWGDE